MWPVITTRAMLDSTRRLVEIEMCVGLARNALGRAHDFDDSRAMRQAQRQIRQIARAMATLADEVEAA